MGSLGYVRDVYIRCIELEGPSRPKTATSHVGKGNGVADAEAEWVIEPMAAANSQQPTGCSQQGPRRVHQVFVIGMGETGNRCRAV